ncbi:hypothetical protein KVR01_000252 [Diaporthe batatas]|uniref:uncharacterized protein n=1 Tax=Diaporthe batatas TaxID=748121 RepID=UPI001D0381A5|nr:uncharacterized protein KVR01_000252 [Diaporthe batatas]KAG8169507.1 hypothetical protein KVR01_000252 [Diaporthe batatas]
MAWDASDRFRARGPHLQTLDFSKSGRDDSVFVSSSRSSSGNDANMTLGGLLSPIEEESGFVFDNAPLKVKVTVRFLDPAATPLYYNRTYSSSAAFEPTDRICRGLLQRIEHCSNELITRNDPEALNTRLRQEARFEINYQLRRDGFPGVWAERTFKSYQKHPVTSTWAKSILCSTHSIICLFLRHHDRHFRWTDEPAHEDFHGRPSTFKPSLAGAPDLACVPRSRLIESTQAWEFVPGFTLELVFKSRNPSRRQALITRNVKVDSKQAAPLNLGQGETLLWQAYRTLEDMLDSRRTAFEIEHADCDGFEGVLDCDCRHYDADALNVDLRVVNNLGPRYEHLHRNIQSRLQLFRHVCGNDCDEFVRSVHERFDQLRDKADAKLGALNDFDLRVTELIGHGWRIKNPARFILDSKTRHTRRTIEALLERIRTGVGDVLRGHDVAVRMIAHKQGHLVLDKALISRNHQPSAGPFAPTIPEDEQALFVAHLKARIQADIDLVCKDTCSLDNVAEAPSSPELVARPRYPPSRPFTPRATVSDEPVLPRVRSPMKANHTTSNTPPGSPGHFSRPPVLPSVSPRSTSMRVFPLVPAKYRGREGLLSTPSEQDSAIAVDSASDGSLLDEATSVASLTMDKAHRVVDGQSQHGNPVHEEASPVLIPAAEVFKHGEGDYDDSSSSRSTCSSVPALTESETATPEQSLLITPSQVRHSSPKSQGQFFNDYGYGEPSSPLVLATTDLSEPTYQPASLSGTQVLTLPKTPITSTAPAFDPGEDNSPTSGSDGALKSTETSTCTEVGSVEDQSCSQEADSASEMHSVTSPTSPDEMSSGLGTMNGTDPAGPNYDRSGCESSEATRRHLQYEGWLLHCVENDHESDSSVPDNTEYPRIAATVTECESSGTPRTPAQVLGDVLVGSGCPAPQPTADPDSIDGKLLLRQVCQPAVAPVTVRQEGTGHSEPPQISEAASPSSTDATETRDLRGGDDLSRSKMDYFEAEEEGTDSEEPRSPRALGDLRRSAPSLQLGEVCESQDMMPYSETGRGISQSPEGTGTSDGECKHLGPESTLPGLSCSERQQSRPDDSNPTMTSEPLVKDGVRVGVLDVPSTVVSGLHGPVQAIDILSPSDYSTAPTPTTPPQDVLARPALAERTPTQSDFRPDGFRQPTVQVKPTTCPDDLKGGFLLPPLPVFASVGSTANQSRASFQSSSSEWEDYVSEARQSSDSVDTIQQAPSLSDHDLGTPERPGSPKRLGTPTAGILGLHESRWADFGIRGALTGSHAFDRPSTAPMLGAERTPGEKAARPGDKAGEDSEETPRPRPATPHRKSLHLLHHKKSISSIIFPGAHHGHLPHQQGKTPRPLSKKESKELKARERSKAKPRAKENGRHGGLDVPKEQNVGDAGRFPRAMMLITGLAIASSVVNRSSA